jgi:hypothetical protein
MSIDSFLSPEISLPALGLIALTALVHLLARDWRWMILALAFQYVGVFILVALVWPISISLVKLVSGWMAGAILALAISNIPESWQQEEQFAPSGRVFRMLAAALVIVMVFSFAPALNSWLPVTSMAHVMGSLVLIGLGLLHLGLTSQPLRAIISLITALSGFEILYATVESSTLVAGLLAGVNIGLALAGAYLLLAPTMEPAE